MNRFFSLRPAFILLVAVAALALPDQASAQERPHFSSGTAQFVSPNDFVGTGNATHLGLYSEVGYVTFSPADHPNIVQIDGWSIYTAANGDELHAVVSGQLDGKTGAITATVTYVGGTGRFADATGSASLAGQLRPGGIVSVAVAGTVEY
jgi:hypothetical protein